MSIEHILLGMLDRPASGYGLKIRFETGAKYFWSAEFSQIYAALRKMVERKWLTSKTMPSKKGPARKVYRRTKTGLQELQRWLSDGPLLGTERHAYVAQMVFLGQLGDPELTLEFVSQLRAKLVDSRTGLAATEKAHQDNLQLDPSDLKAMHAALAAELGLATLRAKIEWCDRVIRKFKKLVRETSLPV